MVIDDRKLLNHPSYTETLAQLTAQRAGPDAAVLDVGAQRKAAQLALGDLQASLPSLRQRYFSVPEDEKLIALTDVEACEDKIHRLENHRDELDLKRLQAQQERCNHMIALCNAQKDELEPELFPMLAKYAAILNELERQRSISKTIPASIGALELQQDRRNLERAQTVERERKRALSMAHRRHAQQEFAR